MNKQNKNNNPFMLSDPLTAILKARLGLNNGFGALIIVLGLNIPIMLMATINNLWQSTSNRVGLFYDYSWWIMNLTSIPATVFFFLWLPDGIVTVLNGLRENKVINIKKSTETKYANYLNSFAKSYSNKIWIFIGFILVMIYLIFFSLPVQQSYKSWQNGSVAIFWYTVFFWSVFFLIGSLVVFRGIVIILWFNKLFNEFEVDVRVLHPDGAGGLSPLGGFSVKVGYLIGIYGLVAVIATIGESYVLTTQFSGLSFTTALIPLLSVYVIMAPIAFFAPIGSARSAMIKAKKDIMLRVSNQFEKDSKNLMKLLDSDASELKRGVEKIEQLQNIHSMAKKFPVWPLNTENLVRFFSAVLSPVVLGIISILIDLLV